MNTFQKSVQYVLHSNLRTKYTLSLMIVLAQVCGNDHWSTSQVQLKNLNYRTLKSLGN